MRDQFQEEHPFPNLSQELAHFGHANMLQSMPSPVSNAFEQQTPAFP